MYKHKDFEYQPEHPRLKNYTTCNACYHLDDRFEHSAACGMLDRKECKQADAIWKKIIAKKDRADFAKAVDELVKKGSIKKGKKLLEELKKNNNTKEYAALLDKLKDKYHLLDVQGEGLYQWWDRNKKKSMWMLFDWLDRVIRYSIDPTGKYAGQRGPVPTLKDIASANTVGTV